MIKLEIDGRETEVENGKTVIEAANNIGIFIPHFCYHKKLTIAANCRMCLVEVEKAPKPLPACATPATNGMKVKTHSEYAVRAQKGVMEFLLINHPLDCPICDQGGECQLQDLAVGYGSSNSRYTEEKRVVVNKNLGPLIATDMTRCIHCTRCVRFGQEIADVKELGMAGRGEASEILSFVGKTVDSEISGNMIDLCPVGALTSKPFRYTARPWELSRRKSISPHDGLGSNLIVQVKANKVMRVLPLENEEINECWLSDRDRFSYEGLNSPERLTRPMLKQGGEWREVEWQVALEYVANGLKQIVAQHGADAVGALATAQQTLEELHLLQKLVRGLGCDNVDFRLRQADFSLDAHSQGAPWLGMPVGDLDRLQSVLIIGSTLRKDHPLIAHRFRQAAKRGCEFNLINPVDDDLRMPVANKAIVAPSDIVGTVTTLLKAVADFKGVPLPAELKVGRDVPESVQRIAQSLGGKELSAIFLGNIAQHLADFGSLYRLVESIAKTLGIAIGVLGEAANSVGGYIAEALPRRGLNAKQMLATPRQAYLLLGAEVELDCHDPQAALAAMNAADMVVAMSAYKHNALAYADVFLPISPFTETAGTFVSTEGRVQSFNGTVKPLGDARPAWKVLRVLGNLLDLKGFDFNEVGDVRRAIGENLQDAVKAKLNNTLAHAASSRGPAARPPGAERYLERIGEVPIYHTDAIVRRAGSLQKTRDAAPPVASMNGALLQRLGIVAGAQVCVRQNEGSAVLKAVRDDRLPDHCVRVPAGHPLTAALGSMFGEIVVEGIAAEQVA